MRRRSFLKGAAAGTATGLAGAPALAQKLTELRMVTAWPKNFPGVGTGAERLARNIEAMSDGRLRVKVYAAGELVPAFEAFDAVSRGAADLYHGVAYYWAGKNKAFNFFGAVPFGLTHTETFAWISHGGGQELWDELYAPFNVKPMTAGTGGQQMGGWYRNPMNSLADFQGLKIRIPGLGGDVMRRIGAAPVATPPGEIFPALQSGALDAAEWISPWADLAFGFHKILKNYYYPGFQEACAPVDLGINSGAWGRLSKDQQAAIRVAAQAEGQTMVTEFYANNARSLDVLTREHGVKLHAFPQDVLKTLGKASHEVVNELAASDPLSRKIFASYDAFRRAMLGWSAISEAPYYQARQMALQ